MNQQGSHPHERIPGTPQRGSVRSLLIPQWLGSYRPDWLRGDVVAGLTAGGGGIPKALADPTIAGLPVQVGLYTVLVPMVIYAVLGTSRPLSVSTTTTLAILAGSALGQISPDGDAATLLAGFPPPGLIVGGSR